MGGVHTKSVGHHVVLEFRHRGPGFRSSPHLLQAVEAPILEAGSGCEEGHDDAQGANCSEAHASFEPWSKLPIRG